MLKESYEILKEAVNILIQRVLENININEFAHEIEEIKEVKNIYNVHIWGLDDSNIFFEGHVNLKRDILVYHQFLCY